MTMYVINKELDKVYVNKETAERACEEWNRCDRMGGGYGCAYVKEVEVVED